MSSEILSNTVTGKEYRPRWKLHDVITGTFIVSTYDEDGTHQIILIESGEAADAGEETASGSSEAASDSTVEEGTDEEEPAASDDAQLSEESSAAQA